MSIGSLNVVGTGIQFVGHVTLEAQAAIEQADKVFFLVNDSFTTQWIKELNSKAESLTDAYAHNKLRLQAYQEMVARILAAVRQGLQVCVVFYGHPGVFVTPAFRAIKQARQEGFRAKMMPGISAEDCLFVDLEFDPMVHGCQTFEATEFLLRKRPVDISSNLILWQVGVVGDLSLNGDTNKALQLLSQVLCDYYGPAHEGVIYEAAQLPILEPRVEYIPLSQLPQARLTRISTLYIPPKEKAAWNQEVMDHLGIDMAALKWQ